MHLHQILLVALCGTLVTGKTFQRTACITGSSHNYVGKHSVTREGYKCQRWDVKYPHVPKKKPQDGGKHNFCRNPDKDMRGTWCYTTDPDRRWDYCEIPKCPANAVIMWASVNEFNNVSSFAEVNADLEYMSQKYGDKTGEATQKSYSKTWENAQFKAFDTNFEKKLLYFTDIQENYFGIYNMETKAMEKFLHGMVENIQAISHDWVTDNFYWTDTRMKAVIVAEPTLQSYTPVYKTTGAYTPLALEVNSKDRTLVFSTYLRKNAENFDSKIIVTDLAGQNEDVLFEYPEIGKVTAITIDYDEDNLYWIEDLGYTSKVVSSSIAGTDRKQQYSDDERAYFDLAVFGDYIYVSDNRKRYNFFDELRYHIQVITKNSDQIAHYKVDEIPKGIATYTNNAYVSKTKPRGPGECIGTCDSICLPTLKGKRRCACSVGYQQSPKNNKCITKSSSGDYLLVVDADEGHAYQISLSSDDEYSIAPLGKASQVISAAVDASTKFAYFSDSRTGSVSRGILNNGLNVPIASAKATHIEIDPITSNVFYSDGKSITVSSSDGAAQKKIVEEETEETDIKAFVLDVKNKYVYWTDTFSEEGAGQLLRSRFDGSRKEVVLDKLHRPYGVTIDAETERLYLLETEKALVYEIILAKLANIRPAAVKQSITKKFELKRFFKSGTSSLTEIKVNNGIAYIIDEKQPQVQKLQLNKAPRLVGFGPAIFYRAASLSVYSRSSSTQGISSPCQNKACALCVDMSTKKAKCLAGETTRKGSKRL